MNKSFALTKEVDAKRGGSSTRSSDKSIHRFRNEPEKQLGSLRSVIGNIRHDGGTPSVDSIATELGSMHIAQRASVLMALQRTHGNRYVQRVVAGIQAKLKVGQPGDKYEQEADRVADAVMQMPEPRVQRRAEEEEKKEEEEEEKKTIQPRLSSDQITPLVQRQVEEEEEEELVQPKLVANAYSIQRQIDEEEEKEEDLIQTKPLVDQITPSVQRQVEEEEEILQTKLEEDTTSEVTHNLELQIQMIRGGGQPLPESVRTYFEPRFGNDFSRVRVHSDAQAAETAQALKARAFTMGRDVVFGTGQYAPGTKEGRRLLAHELTHVVQQDGIETIRRKILIGGKYYIPKRDYVWVKKHYGNAMVEFLKRMHNNGKAPDYKFKNYAEMHKEIQVRYQAIKGMEEVHKDCCSYPSGSGTGKLDATFWDKFGPFTFKIKSPLPAGKKPSDAIEAIFKPGAGTELECNSIMVAIQYRAMLKMLGRAKFNSKFAGVTDIIISPALVGLLTPGGVQRHPIWHKKLYKQVTVSGVSDLLPGDWVYFKNIADYITRHPGGAWSGEHALYLGGGKFRGFGVSEKTESEMKQELLDQYNAGLLAAYQKTIGDVPGLLNFARRPVMKEITK